MRNTKYKFLVLDKGEVSMDPDFGIETGLVHSILVYQLVPPPMYTEAVSTSKAMQ